jgi:hypothetical protein
MPLAQNYIDDVSLVESRAPLNKSTMSCRTTESNLSSRFHMNVSLRRRENNLCLFNRIANNLEEFFF